MNMYFLNMIINNKTSICYLDKLTNDKRKFLFFSTIIVALSLGFYLIPNTINTIVTSSQIFVSAFAQQALPAMPKTDDSFTNANINNILYRQVIVLVNLQKRI